MIQIALVIGLVLVLAPFLGIFLAKLFQGERVFLTPVLQPVEKFIYRMCGVRFTQEQDWKNYLISLLTLNFVGLVVLFLILVSQTWLPLNPMEVKGMRWDTALNTAVSFVTNTNWQAYQGEAQLSYFSQMAGLTVQQFLSAATGIAVLIALTRALLRKSTTAVGNAYVDITRTVLYVMLPVCLLLSVFFVWQGVPQTLLPAAKVVTLEGTEQLLPRGPVASLLAIKQLGTNGGGYFSVNSAHPYENPTMETNLLQLVLILLLPVALPWTFGRMVGDLRQGLTIASAMAFLFIAGLLITYTAEKHLPPALASLPIAAPHGNMEGKEVRFGTDTSAFWAVATTATGSGSVNSMHESFTPLGGLIPLTNILLGEVVFGGVGSGMYGMLIFVMLSVFIAGLMVGRTPEYLGKKIEVREIKLAMIAMLIVPVGTLGLGALSLLLPAGVSSIQAHGPHGLTELLYAYGSAVGNNGSAFAAFTADTPYHNIMLALAMLLGRFVPMMAILAIAGSLVKKQPSPVTSGTFPTHGLQFAGLLVGIVLIIGGLTFFPVLMLGPLVEHVLMMDGKLF